MKRKTAIAVLLAVTATLALALTPEQEAACTDGGGCVIATRQAIMELMQEAYKRGQKSCGNFI